MHTPTKAQQTAVLSTITGFEKDGSTDYSRMEASLTSDLGVTPDNKFIWACINKVEATKVTVDTGWL